MKFADLHLHTIFSDGTYTPVELIRQSKKSGLSAIAVVDHDTVSGIQPSIEAAKKEGIEVIPGIELSAEFDGMEIHILGYFIDYKNILFQNKLKDLSVIRTERIYKILDKLNGLGIKLGPKAVFNLAKNGTVGRLHIARALVNEGKVASAQEAFKKYIGDNCSCYVCGFRFNPQEAIKFIKDFGGIPVLAHPYVLNQDGLIPQFVDYGLMGIEVYYPEHTQSMINFYLNMAKKYNLLVTGGSDCHGKAKPEVKIGMVKLPYELVEKLIEAQNLNKA